MKKIRLTLIVLLALFAILHTSGYAERPIKIVVGGEKLETDVAPTVINERTMLPVRAVFEAIGAKVKYDANTRTVTATKRDKTVKLVIDSDIMTVNGEQKTLDVPATIINSRTLVPVRACAEAFDLDVEWIDKTRTVKIKKEVSLPLNAVGEPGEYTYDERGNAVRISDGDWWLNYTYDENDNLIYDQDSYGGWNEYQYDEYGNIVFHQKVRSYSNTTSWEKYSYDENDNEIYYEDSDGYWRKCEFDKNNNPVYYENSKGEWTKYNYDINGNLVYEENYHLNWNNSKSYYSSYWDKYTYDDVGHLIYSERSNGYWEKHSYDSNGNETFYEDSDGDRYSITYDENGNETYREGLWHEYIYDDVPGVTQKIHSYWERRVYDENGNNTFYEGTGLLDPFDHYGEIDLYGWYKYTYNEYGDMIFWEDSGGVTGELKYDNNGNLLYADFQEGFNCSYIVMVK